MRVLLRLLRAAAQDDLEDAALDGRRPVRLVAKEHEGPPFVGVLLRVPGDLGVLHDRGAAAVLSATTGGATATLS